MWKLTQHPRQYLYHYDNGVCFSFTTIVLESKYDGVVQIHNDYVGKCTHNRIAAIADMFNQLQELFKEQGMKTVLTYTTKFDKKMKKYWSLLGFTDIYIKDDVTFSYKEI